MQDSLQTDDLTRPLVEPDSKYGKFEADPSDPFIQRYIPAPEELDRINDYLKEEIGQAILDDEPVRKKKLDLLRAYKAEPSTADQILILPLVKRAVNQNVAWVKNTIMAKRPLVTVTPDSNDSIEVLVDDPTFGPVPVKKTSEEVAQAIELWLEWKLRKRVNFDSVVEVAALEAKRGQTPTWIKVVHSKEKRTVKTPRFEQSGPVAVTFQTKDDLEVYSCEPTRLENVSTYSMLMPADEQDPQESRWLAEHVPMTSEALRRALYNGDYFLIKKDERADFINDGADRELSPVEEQKAAAERRAPSAPKGRHDVWEVWFFWTVPMKKTIADVDPETGEGTVKTVTVNQEYSFVGHFHRKHGRLMDMIRNPFDHGLRPYIPVFDRKEPFRHSGESIAEDVEPYQRVISQLNSLEIRGGVIATTPVTYAEPGSIAGDWVMENSIEPGSVIPRQRPEEIETKQLGERPQTLLGVMQFHHQNYEKDVSIGDLQLGLGVQSHVPSSAVAQALSAGETRAAMFLGTFRRDLAAAIKLLVQTEQQYMRFGKVIPFDPETRATILAALQPGEEPPDMSGVPVRFPTEPIHDQFAFNITASPDDRNEQNDFERLVALKKLIDADGMTLAQIITPIASGQLPQSLINIYLEQVKRSEKVMELIAKSMRKDGAAFAISPKLLGAFVEEQQQVAAMAAEQEAQLGAQGVGPGGFGPGVGAEEGGLGADVPQPGGAPVDYGDQAPPDAGSFGVPV